MKQFLFLIFCTLSAAFVSCKEETDGAADFRFVQPEVTDVTQTTANVSSRALFTLNDYPGLVKGFAYGPADEAAEDYRTLTVADFARNAISADHPYRRYHDRSGKAGSFGAAFVRLDRQRPRGEGAWYHDQHRPR